ncbi:MAG: dihydrolipoamide dehydrogenase [Chloroflexota bacterium]|jgi:dihydrolipoamide dehydrogenase|nr:dihydrolipoamide dehydrogenase [Chloroflexota bacterium]
MADRFDLVVIGGGTGGYMAAIRASQLGQKVALVERAKLGGTCLHQGCIPTKALLHTADVYQEAKTGAALGVVVSGLEVDWPAANARKQKIVDQLHKGLQFLMKKNKIEVVEGTAAFDSPQRVSVSGGAGVRQIEATSFVIASGSYAKSLPGVEIDGKRVISSDHALAMDAVPASAIVVGAGAVGVEFASMWADLGSQVTVVEALPRIVPAEDPEVSQVMTRAFKKRGIEVHAGAKLDLKSVKASGDGVRMKADAEGGPLELSADVMLMAVGRGAVVDGLGLEKTAVKVEGGFISVDDDLRTAEPNIFAIGDVVGGYQLAHVAGHEGIHAVEVIAGEKPGPLDYNKMPRCTYSRPQVASVGLTEEQAAAAGVEVKVGKFPFSALGRAMINDDTEGFVKIVADASTGEMLGAHLVGHNVTDLVAEPVLAQLLEGTAWEVGIAVHAHPTLSEAIGEAALAVDGRAIHI